jgi:hypothetical protein
MRRFVFILFSTSFLHTLLFISQAMGQPQPPPPRRPSPELVLEGTVRDLATDRGLPGLTMRLIPPNSERSPVRIVRTDERGNFRFRDTNNRYLGRHLLEIYQGAELVFRKEIDTKKDWKIKIRVRPVS